LPVRSSSLPDRSRVFSLSSPYNRYRDRYRFTRGETPGQNPRSSAIPLRHPNGVPHHQPGNLMWHPLRGAGFFVSFRISPAILRLKPDRSPGYNVSPLRGDKPATQKSCFPAPQRLAGFIITCDTVYLPGAFPPVSSRPGPFPGGRPGPRHRSPSPPGHRPRPGQSGARC